MTPQEQDRQQWDRVVARGKKLQQEANDPKRLKADQEFQQARDRAWVAHRQSLSDPAARAARVTAWHAAEKARREAEKAAEEEAAAVAAFREQWRAGKKESSPKRRLREQR